MNHWRSVNWLQAVGEDAATSHCWPMAIIVMWTDISGGLRYWDARLATNHKWQQLPLCCLWDQCLEFSYWALILLCVFSEWIFIFASITIFLGKMKDIFRMFKKSAFVIYRCLYCSTMHALSLNFSNIFHISKWKKHLIRVSNPHGNVAFVDFREKSII